jgi:chemotaxis protein histidine kinase CheA
MYKYQDVYIKYLNLGHKYKLSASQAKDKWSYITIIKLNEQKLAIECSEILGEKSLVVKPIDHLTRLGSIVEDRQELLGLSLLGDGKMVQVLDISNFY